MALGRTLTTAAGNAEALRAALDQLLASKPQKSQGPGSQQQPTREGETPSEDPNAGSATGVVAPEGKQTDSSDGERAWLQQVQEVEAAAVSLQQALMQRLLELPGRWSEIGVYMRLVSRACATPCMFLFLCSCSFQQPG